MTDLDHKTFDIADMFTGIAYPTDSVAVYTNPDVAYRLHKLGEEALDVVREKNEERAREIEVERDELVKQGEASRYVVHLRGQSRDNREAVIDKVRSKYPAEYDFLGREKVEPAADKMFANLMWALHIERIEAPNGAIKAPVDESDIRILRGNLEDSEINKIESAIQELSAGAKGGFETLAQEHDFLSGASVEA